MEPALKVIRADTGLPATIQVRPGFQATCLLDVTEFDIEGHHVRSARVILERTHVKALITRLTEVL